MTTPFPLCWPAGVPRTNRPTRPPFGRATQTLGRCRDELVQEIELLRATTLVLSTNIPMRIDGSIWKADAQLAKPDAGVAVYFTHPTRGKLVVACDKWNTVAGNLWAIKRTLENLRQIRRWGTGEMADQALGGFAGHLPYITPAAPWWVILEFGEEQSRDVTMAAIEKRARELSKRYHTDSPLGGDAARFAAIRAGLAAARAERGVNEGAAS